MRLCGHKLTIALSIGLAAVLVPGATAAAPGAAQDGGVWGPTETISTEGAAAAAPRVVVDKLGDTTVTWEQGGRIMAARRGSGGTWSAPVDLGTGRAPAIDADGAGNVFVTWAGPRRSVLVARLRAGHGWGDPVTLSPKVFGGSSSSGAGSPELDVGDGGAAAVVWTFGTSSSPVVYQARGAYRAPGGRWQRETLSIDRPAKPQPVVAVGPTGDVDVVYGNPRVMAVRKPAGGDWRRPVHLDRDGWYARIAVGPDGHAVAVWQVALQGPRQPLFAARRQPGGWSEPRLVSDPRAAAFFYDVAVDGAGQASVAWAENPGQVLVAERPSGGDWGPPLLVSDSGDGSISDPALSAGPTGDALLAWTHGVSLGDDYDFFAEAAVRSVASWSAPERVTPYGDGEPSAAPGSLDTSVGPDGVAVLVWAHQVGVEPARIVVRSFTS